MLPCKETEKRSEQNVRKVSVQRPQYRVEQKVSAQKQQYRVEQHYRVLAYPHLEMNLQLLKSYPESLLKKKCKQIYHGQLLHNPTIFCLV